MGPGLKVRAYAATRTMDATSDRVAPSTRVMSPESGSAFRPWPGKSKVTAV